MRKISTIATAPDIQDHAVVQGVPLLNDNHQDCGPEQSDPRPADSDSTQVSEPLSTAERNQLVECESLIAAGWQHFVNVGRALHSVRKDRLYREDFGTFEDYCRVRWQFSRVQAHRLIGAAEVIEVLLPIGNILPANELQTRPLVGLQPEEIRVVWRAVLALNVVVTGRVVAETVIKILHKPSCGAGKKDNNSTGRRERLNKYLNDALKDLDRLEQCLPAGSRDTATGNAMNSLRKSIRGAIELVQPGGAEHPSKNSLRKKAEFIAHENTVPGPSGRNGPNGRSQPLSLECGTKGANENGRACQRPAENANSKNCDELANCVD